jgi:hypothetical protein
MAGPPSSTDPGISWFVDEISTSNPVHDDRAPAAKSLHDDSIGHPLQKVEFATVQPEPIKQFEQNLAETSL